MSGIAGIARRSPAGVSVKSLGAMAAAIKHRGPDSYGFYAGTRVGLAHVGLNPLDGDKIAQPLTNEDGQIVLVANCEIFNHPELRKELEERGHVFRTRAHAEVLVHGYEEWGAEMLSRLDGQFAFAIYDRNHETILVARDRFGIRPLYYAQRSGDFYFGSEIKAILATREVDAAVDPRGLDETLRCGAARPPRTTFSGIAALEPGTYGLWRDGALWLRHYYEFDYPELSEEPQDVIEQLDEILLRSVGLRLRGTNPVGAYLSGGLDSSVIASLARSAATYPFRTFSIAYAVPEFDDSLHQHETALAIGSDHVVSVIDFETIALTLSEVLWHAETPVLSTRPALMFHLAKLASEAGIKVVVGGEGADEIFLGAEIFKEASVRRFCMRHPESAPRAKLFDRVFAGSSCLTSAERTRLLSCGSLNDPLFSHLPRFQSTGISEIYSADFRSSLGGIDVVSELRASLPTRFFAWSPLNQAAYLEMTTRLSPYILSSHGDRMAAAHGVDARYPFLDHRVFEFVSALPTGSRLRGLRDKEVLRRWASRTLPPKLRGRGRLVPRPAETQPLFLPASPPWIGEHLSPDSLRRTGIFSPSAVADLELRARGQLGPSHGEAAALLGVLTTQLWHQQFVDSTAFVQPLPASEASVLLSESATVQDRISAPAGYADSAFS